MFLLSVVDRDTHLDKSIHWATVVIEQFLGRLRTKTFGPSVSTCEHCKSLCEVMQSVAEERYLAS